MDKIPNTKNRTEEIILNGLSGALALTAIALVVMAIPYIFLRSPFGTLLS
jgi:hypothetical protein